MVTRKKISKRNAISAIDPALISLLALDLLFAMFDYLKKFLISDTTITIAAVAIKSNVVQMPPLMVLLTPSVTAKSLANLVQIGPISTLEIDFKTKNIITNTPKPKRP